MFLWINLREFLALEVMLFMWLAQFRSLEIVTPRYLAVSADFNVLLCRVYGKMVGFLFRVILSTSHLSGLNSILQSVPEILGSMRSLKQEILCTENLMSQFCQNPC